MPPENARKIQGICSNPNGLGKHCEPARWAALLRDMVTGNYNSLPKSQSRPALAAVGSSEGNRAMCQMIQELMHRCSPLIDQPKSLMQHGLAGKLRSVHPGSRLDSKAVGTPERGTKLSKYV